MQAKQRVKASKQKYARATIKRPYPIFKTLLFYQTLRLRYQIR